MLMTLVATSACDTEEAAPQPPPLKVSKNVTLAGPITEFAQSELRDSDTLVIDLRLADEEGTLEEGARLSEAGIRYLHFPMGREVTRDQVERFATALSENSDRPLLLHCSSGNRAGLLWAAHLIEQGGDAEQAIRLVSPIANRVPIQQAIRDYQAVREVGR